MDEQNSILEETALCSNCTSPLINKPAFCPNCGQKNTDCRLTLKELFSQFFDTLFSIDSKIFQTLGAVLIPGKLTNAFLSGKRRKYYHPIRLFLVLIVISLAALNFHSDLSFPTNLKKDQIDKLQERKRLMGVLDTAIMSISEKTDQLVVLEAMDSLSTTFYRKAGKRIDTFNINDVMRITDDFDYYIALDDIGKYSPEEIIEVYEIKGFYRRLVVRQKIKMAVEGTSFVPFIMGKVTWVIFFVLLLLSLIFKIFYINTNFLYLEHLIFGIHLNAFFLIFVSIQNLFPWEMIERFLPLTFIIMGVYFYIALKRVYKESYLLTSLKFIVLFFCYFISFVFGVFLSVVGSFMIY